METYCIFQNAESGIELSQKIDISTTCAEFDYTCLYWNTDHEFSMDQISCYTPPLPYENKILVFKSGITFTVHLRTSTGVEFKCANQELCQVYYYKESTPELVSIEPQNVFFGQEIQFRFNPRGLWGADNESLKNPVENKLIELKVGSSNCIFATQYNRDDDIIEKR